MRKYFFILIYLAAQLPLHAQKNNYVDGLIITSENDTIHCSIQKRNWKNQPEEIKIKYNEKDSVLGPKNIKGFFIPSLGLKYKTKEVGPVNYNDNTLKAPGTKIPDRDTVRSAFLKFLYQGEITLFTYYDALGKKHLFVESQNDFMEIYFHYYTGFYKRAILEYKQYVDALKFVMASCDSLFTTIEHITLKEERLIELFKMYEQCVGLKVGE